MSMTCSLCGTDAVLRLVVCIYSIYSDLEFEVESMGESQTMNDTVFIVTETAICEHDLLALCVGQICGFEMYLSISSDILQV